ncbi:MULTISPECIES: DMT family transporter [unclassified Imperialibacter]|uniref:DMT family transporter n=1 Tax=unclassified Imperialibacter TaxID=2629706 RepID=UPI00125ACC27|nr:MULTISPECIES: DMT family transporter [unclassified Imperialibacter]CAD5263150.1 EamA family transporter [Imperialibacter sp. 75]CAD5275312.1 EamA family transporter [Imperialibacter sp. 89]VVT08092.1 EamA family transporter [Imperialibacter sp. EC-SDR9]
MQAITLTGKEKWAALGLAALGSTMFSAKAVFIKLAYQFDISSIDLMSLRMLMALPFYAGILWWTNRKKEPMVINRKDVWRIVLYGIMGYYIASYFDFWGLEYVSASMERLILFIYPTLVVILSAIFTKKKVTKWEVLAIGITYSGMLLAFFDKIKIGGVHETLIGGSLIFVSALTYAIYLIGSGRLIPKFGTVRFTSLSMIVACIAVIFHNLIANGQLALLDFPWQIYTLALMIALISTVIPSFLISEAIKRIGSSEVAITGNIGPISTIILSMIFLHEIIGFWQWAGTAIVLFGVSLLSRKKG